MEKNKIVIYGAGERGRGYYDFLKEKGICNDIFGFCDRDYAKIKAYSDKKVYDYEQIKGLGFQYIVSIADVAEKEELKKVIETDGNRYIEIEETADLLCEDRRIFNRELCAFFHKKSMDTYFKNAESKELIDIFWCDNSLFLKFFRKLDLSQVIELACGRGRHVPHYIDKAGTVTLVDILQENIDFCRKRFEDMENIAYYCNNGYNLEHLESNGYTALFCYDAMVHFELLDIYEYLKDIYRVLKPNGYALIHHSNNGNDYKASFANQYNGRSFMTKDVFAYLAYRAGFSVVEQQVIDWTIKDIDCISLIRKD